MKKFKKICRMAQKDLKKWMTKFLKDKYNEVVSEDGFVYAKGDGSAPILLTAHMDTVHKELPKNIVIYTNQEGNTVLTSPQGIGGDDRCGIWMIYQILQGTQFRPSILLCEDEEIGGVGSAKFVDTKYADDLKELKYLLELDRANEFDAVYYSCGNDLFREYIEEEIGYKENFGSFSDIGHLSPACDKASVNLSCGYYKQHTKEEFVVYEEMRHTKDMVVALLKNAKDCPSFDYQEERWDMGYGKTTGHDYDYFGRRSYDRYAYDYDYDYGTSAPAFEYSEWTYEFTYYADGKEAVFVIEAISQEEAVGAFLMKHPTLCWNDVIDYACY